MQNAIYRYPILVLAVVLSMFSFAFAGWLDDQSESLPSGEFDAVVFDGTTAYCATGAGLTVIDMSDPTNPDAIYLLPTPGLCKGVALDMSTDYVYLADGSEGLVVVDVTGALPVIVASLPLEGYARSVEYCNDNLVVCLEEGGLVLVDVMDPTDPTVVDQVATTGRVLYADYSAGYIYVTHMNALTSYQVSLTDLTQIQTMAGDFYGVCVNSGLMYATTGSAVNVYDLGGSGTWDPSPINIENLPGAGHVSRVGANVAVAYDHSVAIVSSSTVIGSVATEMDPQFVYAPGIIAGYDLIVVCEGYYGAQVVDATNPGNPLVLGDVPYAGGPRNVFVSGDFAYVAYHLGGVVIMNIANPQNPVTVANIQFPGTWTYDVEVYNNTLYVCNWHLGLFSFNVTNPLQPVPLDTVSLPEGSRSIIAKGSSNYLLLVHNTGGIYKYNITNPANIALLGNAAVPGGPRDIALRASTNHAFVAAYDSGAVFYDVSGNTPVRGATYAMGRVRSCAVNGNRLYVGGEEGFMDIVNITTISAPFEIAGYISPGAINGVVFGSGGNPVHNYVFLFSWEYGVEVIRVDDDAPMQDFYYNTHSLAKDGYFSAATGRLYGADSYALYIWNIDWTTGVINPENPVVNDYALMGSYPNPFNPVTNLVFNMKNAGSAVITVYDLNGGQVAVVAEGNYSAGVHEVQFNASNLPSGVYFAKFEADGFSQTQKLLLVK